MAIGELSGYQMGQATRDAFGDALAALGDEFPALVTVDGDVGNSTRTEPFALKYPERGFNVGIAESNMVSVAGGLAGTGKIPVVASFACFLLNNAFDQIRMSVAFPNQNVKLVGTHAGISIGEDGPSQMGIEDVSLACSMPGVVVMVPADAVTAKKATRAMVEHQGPTYLRLGRPNVPALYDDSVDFQIGKSITLKEGSDATIIANGLMVSIAADAAKLLSDEGIDVRVVDMHTVKPIDREAVVSAAKETGCIVVAEEHLHHGGLGSAVAQVVSEEHPVPMGYVNVGDCYAESGDPMGLLGKYGLTAEKIVSTVKAVKAR
ncbi:MAG: transketolase C-terminal domain-containing protein [Planctomycetaceae bacterium]|jgi:transketolase|nr:transketolase C-terminal domain-containing protein [Planctomycetaceae bacterium]